MGIISLSLFFILIQSQYEAIRVLGLNGPISQSLLSALGHIIGFDSGLLIRHSSLAETMTPGG